MADEQAGGAAAPAETTPAPAADAPLSISDAVGLLNKQDEQQANDDKKTPQSDDQQPQAEASEAESEGIEDAPATEAEEPETSESTEGTEEDIYIHGNARTRLRDGTVTTIGELKKLPDRLRELERELETAKAPKPEWEQKQAQLAQQEQYLSQILPQAVQIALSAIPPEPDVSLRESDPIEFFTQKSRREEKVREYQNLQMAQEAETQKNAKSQQEALEKYIKEQREKLIEVRPEIKDPAKAKEHYDLVVKGAEAVGFSKQDVEKTYDHRLVLMAEKAARWDAHLAEQAKLKPIVQQKLKDVPPVQQPGRRIAPQQAEAKRKSELFQKFDQKRDIDSAVAYLNALE